MADTEAYSEFKKKEEQAVTATPRRPRSAIRRMRVVTFVRPPEKPSAASLIATIYGARVSPDKAEDYAVHKAIATATAEEIKREMRAQHDLTRAAVQNAKVDVLAAIKASPAEYLKLMSEFGSLFLVFSLAVRFALKIELVNTAFALFMLVAFASYWGMAHLQERADRRKQTRT